MIGRARPCCVANYMPGKLPSLPERSPNKRTDNLLAIHKCRLALPTLDKSVKKVSPTSPVRCEMRRGSPGTSSHESQSLSHGLTYLTSTLRVHRPTHITCRQDPSWSDRCVESFFIFFPLHSARPGAWMNPGITHRSRAAWLVDKHDPKCDLPFGEQSRLSRFFFFPSCWWVEASHIIIILH